MGLELLSGVPAWWYLASLPPLVGAVVVGLLPTKQTPTIVFIKGLVSVALVILAVLILYCIAVQSAMREAGPSPFPPGTFGFPFDIWK
jgi:uncharacterized membrane protein YhaH (DUF805 family)